jgi:hypothetical protein
MLPGSPPAGGQPATKPRGQGVSGRQVLAAAVGAKPVQCDHVHGNNGQRPEGVGRDEEHHVNGIEPDQGDREPAGQLVARQDAARGDQLQEISP